MPVPVSAIFPVFPLHAVAVTTADTDEFGVALMTTVIVLVQPFASFAIRVWIFCINILLVIFLPHRTGAWLSHRDA